MREFLESSSTVGQGRDDLLAHILAALEALGNLAPASSRTIGFRPPQRELLQSADRGLRNHGDGYPGSAEHEVAPKCEAYPLARGHVPLQPAVGQYAHALDADESTDVQFMREQ